MEQQEDLDRLLAIVTGEAVSLFEGDQNAADKWLNKPLRAINYEIPMEYMDTPDKIQQVRDIIGRIEHGIPN